MEPAMPSSRTFTAPETIYLLWHSAEVTRDATGEPVVALNPHLWADLEAMALDPATAEWVAEAARGFHLYARPTGRRWTKRWLGALIFRTIGDRIVTARGHTWYPNADGELVLVESGPRYPLTWRPSPTGSAVPAASPAQLPGSLRPSPAVREELRRFLQADQTRVGYVYRLRAQGHSRRYIADQAGISPGFVSNADAAARALLDGTLPGGSCLPVQVARKVKVALRWPGLSGEAQSYLRELLAALSERAPS
jgi:hypothetical protein